MGWFEWFLQVIEKNLATKHIAAAAMDLSHDSTVLASNSFYEFFLWLLGLYARSCPDSSTSCSKMVGNIILSACKFRNRPPHVHGELRCKLEYDMPQDPHINELSIREDDCDEEFVSTAGDAPFLDSAEERVHPDTTSGATPAPAAESCPAACVSCVLSSLPVTGTPASSAMAVSPSGCKDPISHHSEHVVDIAKTLDNLYAQMLGNGPLPGSDAFYDQTNVLSRLAPIYRRAFYNSGYTIISICHSMFLHAITSYYKLFFNVCTCNGMYQHGMNL